MKKILVPVLVFTALVACSKHSELHEAMEGMGDSYKAMKKSDNLETMKSELESFVTGFEIAKQQKVKEEDQETFDEGMQEVSDQLAVLRGLIESGNVQEAKKALEQLHDIQEKFHDKLDVED